MRIAKEGWIVLVPMLLLGALAAAAAWLFSSNLGTPLAAAIITAIGLLLAWALWFFRDPHRAPPPNAALDGLVISPADGKVIKIDQKPLPPELHAAAQARGISPDQPFHRIAIFLNLFNVHVNYTPAAGQILHTTYIPGLFVNASFDKASTHNERLHALLQTPAGEIIAFSQIAGLVARRIVCHLKPGQTVTIGERFGLIRFGSRAEVYLPLHVQIDTKVGDHLAAGTSIIARKLKQVAPASASTPAITSTPAPVGAAT
jgi:phosphatidylserine decarboxylase